MFGIIRALFLRVKLIIFIDISIALITMKNQCRINYINNLMPRNFIFMID